jgi:hypothetical protein
MTRRLAVCVALLAAAGSALADEEPGGGVKAMSGMSVLGNQEAPKALVIVPWKSSEQGDRQGVTSALDERARPSIATCSCGSSVTTRSEPAAMARFRRDDPKVNWF